MFYVHIVAINNVKFEFDDCLGSENAIFCNGNIFLFCKSERLRLPRVIQILPDEILGVVKG